MRLKVIGTGSSGNAYLLEQDGDVILLDAGVKWRKILDRSDDWIRNVSACLVTHEHLDHSKCVADVTGHGIPTVMSEGTKKTLLEKDRKIRHTNCIYTLSAGESITIQPFTIMAVKALHDAAEPLAFIVRHDPTRETALYATDTYALPNRYPGINHWLVECNYTIEKARELLEQPEKSPLFERLIRSHMSLERLCGSLMVNDLSKTRTIVLIHISNERGDSPLMQETVQKITGIKTIAACNGMNIELGDCPF